MIKSPLLGSEKLLQCLQDQLGPGRKALLIAVDGVDGVGKSSLASWLGWQLGMPTVHLDFYVIRESSPLRWMTDELARMIGTRLDIGRPVIVEGIRILDALDQIKRSPDFLIYVRGADRHSFSRELSEYRMRQKPEVRAQFSLEGFSD